MFKPAAQNDKRYIPLSEGLEPMQAKAGEGKKTKERATPALALSLAVASCQRRYSYKVASA
jgi:hypothetical protein